MRDKPISAWCMAALMTWTITFGLMFVGTVADHQEVIWWGLCSSALAATVTIGCFHTRQTQALQEVILLRQEAREAGLIPLQRTR